MREDIIVAIKNAVERGYSLEQARQVLVNSGYNIGDINEAYNYLTGGVMPQPISQPSQNPSIQQSQIPSLPEPQIEMPGNYPPLPVEPVKKKKSSVVVILLVFILVVLVIGLILTFFFKEQISQFLADTFS
ncbi:MAG: hypothetical protein WC781_04950 [Candidatus Pacearchaeota archaeon]|jgi:hypothetical protein